VITLIEDMSDEGVVEKGLAGSTWAVNKEKGFGGMLMLDGLNNSLKGLTLSLIEAGMVIDGDRRFLMWLWKVIQDLLQVLASELCMQFCKVRQRRVHLYQDSVDVCKSCIPGNSLILGILRILGILAWRGGRRGVAKGILCSFMNCSLVMDVAKIIQGKVICRLLPQQ